MPWSKRFKTPIVLKDGREPRTLREAGDLLLQISGGVSKNEPLARAGDLLLRAGETGAAKDIAAAREQVCRALEARKLM